MVSQVSLIFAMLVSGGALAHPALPTDVPTVASLGREVKAPLAQKMRELRRAFRVEETQPGRVELVASNQVVKGRVELTRSLTPDGKRRIERVQVLRADGVSVIDETVTTHGSDLKYSEPAKKIFMEMDDQDYALNAGESRKEVRLAVENKEHFRMVSARVGEAGNGIQTDFYFSGNKVLSAQETKSADSRYHSLEYRTHTNQFSFRFLDTVMERYLDAASAVLKVEAMRPQGLLLDEYRYYADRAEVYGLEPFLSVFQTKVYQPYFSNGAGRASTLIAKYLPDVPVRKNLALKNRFLDELVLLSTRVEQAKSTPSVLTQVSTTISTFIAAMQEGALEVKDNRPALE